MQQKKKTRRRIILLIIIIPLIVIITGLCICTVLVRTDNIADKYTLTEKSSTYTKNILKGAVTGKSFDLSETEVNTWLNEKYCVDSGGKNIGNGLYNIMVCFHSGKPSEVYARICTEGHFVAVSAELALSADGEGNVIAELHNAKAGELKIPDFILSRILSNVFHNNIYLIPKETSIYIKAGYSYEFKHSSVSLYITELNAGEAILHCRTNSLTREAINAAIDYLTSDEGLERISIIYNGMKNKIGSFFNG